MQGHEHYQAAERLLSDASFTTANGDPCTRDGRLTTCDQRAALVGRAQVHATLALAAATAIPEISRLMGDSERVTDWGHAIGWTNRDQTKDEDR